ncbi:MAG: hypothetical protein LPK00_07990 [Bacillaceae bacterium]|nr:hypothetical protein [Bacillaceae bacterium]
MKLNIFKSKLTRIQKGILLGTTATVVIALIIATQSFLSYKEVTKAAEGCYNIGGVPVIEKSGWKMTYFNCEVQ